MSSPNSIGGSKRNQTYFDRIKRNDSDLTPPSSPTSIFNKLIAQNTRPSPPPIDKKRKISFDPPVNNPSQKRVKPNEPTVDNVAKKIFKALDFDSSSGPIGRGNFKNIYKTDISNLKKLEKNAKKHTPKGNITEKQLAKTQKVVSELSKSKEAVFFVPKLETKKETEDATTITPKDHKTAIDDYKKDCAQNKMIRKELNAKNLLPNNLSINHVITYKGQEYLFCGYEELSSVDQLSKGKITGLPNSPEARALHILGGAANGYSILHEADIIVVDIAARNILLGKDNENQIISMASDWGHALKLDQEYYKMDDFGGQPVKTIAPETYQSRQYSKKTDVYALGITLLEISLGGAQFSSIFGNDPEKIFDEMKKGETVIVNGKFKIPKLIWDGIDPINSNGIKDKYSDFQHLDDKTKEIILKCLQSDPNKRPTMEEAKKMIDKQKQNFIEKEVSVEEESTDSDYYQRLDDNYLTN